jgi:hypothetical protein
MNEFDHERNALQRFVESIEKELIPPDANETPAHEHWRLLYTTLARFDLYRDAGLVTPEEEPHLNAVFESVRQREREAHATMLAEQRQGR